MKLKTLDGVEDWLNEFAVRRVDICVYLIVILILMGVIIWI